MKRIQFDLGEGVQIAFGLATEAEIRPKSDKRLGPGQPRVRLCKNCHHTPNWHFDYDDALDRFTEHPCEHWTGCECRHYEEELA